MRLNPNLKRRLLESRQRDGIVPGYARAAIRFYRSLARDLGLMTTAQFEIVGISSFSKEHEYRSSQRYRAIIFDAGYCESLKNLYLDRAFFESPAITYFHVAELFSQILYTSGQQEMALKLSMFARANQQSLELLEGNFPEQPKFYRNIRAPYMTSVGPHEREIAALIAHFIIGHEFCHHILAIDHPLSQPLNEAASFGVSSQYAYASAYDHTTTYHLDDSGMATRYVVSPNRNPTATVYNEAEETMVRPDQKSAAETACDLFAFLILFSFADIAKPPGAPERDLVDRWDQFKMILVFLELVDVMKSLSMQVGAITANRKVEYSYPKFLGRVRALLFSLRYLQTTDVGFRLMDAFPGALRLIDYLDLEEERTSWQVMQIGDLNYASRQAIFTPQFIQNALQINPHSERYKVLVKQVEPHKFSDDIFYKNYRLHHLSEFEEFNDTIQVGLYRCTKELIALCCSSEHARNIAASYDILFKHSVTSAYEFMSFPSKRVLRYPLYPVDVPNWLMTSNDSPKFGHWRGTHPEETAHLKQI